MDLGHSTSCHSFQGFVSLYSVGRKDTSISLFVDLNVSGKKKAKINVSNLKPFNAKKNLKRKGIRKERKEKFFSQYSKDINRCPLHEDVTVMAFFALGLSYHEKQNQRGKIKRG